MIKKLVAAAAVSAFVLSMAGSANAVTFTAVAPPTQTVNIEFDGYLNEVLEDDQISADLSLSLNSVVGNTWSFSYTLENTSVLDSRLSVFGFLVTPNTFTTSGLTGFDLAVTGSNDPPQAVTGAVNLCLKELGSQTNNCNNGDDGIAEGASMNGGFSLIFAGDAPTSVSLDNLFVRFQSLPGMPDSGVGVPCSGLSCGGGGNEIPVPEPGTWALMILGFGAAGGMLRRRRRYAMA